jgi:hypothetical protein
MHRSLARPARGRRPANAFQPETSFSLEKSLGGLRIFGSNWSLAQTLASNRVTAARIHPSGSTLSERQPPRVSQLGTDAILREFGLQLFRRVH